MAGRIIVCHHCDAVYRQVPIAAGQKARCLRCGTVLYRGQRLGPSQMLALVLAALITFVIANAFPIVELSIQGARSHATLFGSVTALWRGGRQLVAVMVGATTLLAPMVDLSLMLLLLLSASSARHRHHFAYLLRLVRTMRPWGMIEIFMLGVLVSLVKLSHLASVVPGIALWAFCALTLLLAFVVSWDPEEMPEAANEKDEAPGGVEPVRTAAQLGLVACHHCGEVSAATNAERCPRCAAPLHSRHPASLSHTWAFLIAAALLYLPANILPVMETSSLFGESHDTIMSGIVYFWHSGSQGLAALIFTVSILVPMLKLGVLSFLAISVQFRLVHGARQRTTLFRWLEAIGRWSMLDIFVVALMVGLVRFRSLAVIEAGPGAAAFGAVVVLTMLAARSFDPRLIWDNIEDPDVG